MGDYDLNDREYKIAVIKKQNEIKENSGSSMSSGIPLMDRRSTLPKIETIKKNQISELKNSINEKECIRKHWK